MKPRAKPGSNDSAPDQGRLPLARTSYLVALKMECTPSDRTRGWLKFSSDVFSGGEIPEPAGRMEFVAVVHPLFDFAFGRFGVRYRVDADVVRLEGYYEGFGHAVAFRGFPPSSSKA